MAFLDLRKAFDSVSHSSIVRVAYRTGLPPPLLHYLLRLYQNGSTTFFGRSVALDVGVRQGDPLSPLLFNVVVDEVLERVTSLGFGHHFGKHCFNAFCFADDLVLIASSKMGLQHLVDVALADFSHSGLLPNPLKCRTLAILSDGASKTWFCDDKPFLHIFSTPVPALSVLDTYKYLGVHLSARDTVVSFSSQLNTKMQLLLKAPLKPQQRLYILRTHLLPSFGHSLTSGSWTVQTLKQLDLSVRRFVRQTSRLPHDTPTSFFYAACCDGGLCLPSFRSRVLILQRTCLSALAKIPEPDITSTWSSSYFQRKIRQTPPLCLDNTPISFRSIETKVFQLRLHASFDGRGLSNCSEVKSANSWVSDGSSLLTGGNFLRAIKVRGNLLPTDTRCSRGGRVPLLCDAGFGSRGSLGHILQSCSRTHDQRVHRRHNRVCDLLEDFFHQLSFVVTTLFASFWWPQTWSHYC